jgi:hypothetical protein
VTQIASDGIKLAVPRQIVPAYFHPASHQTEWALLAKRSSQIRLVILNRANGPGSGPDPVHFAAITRLRAAGVAVAGYVDTAYGQRPAGETLADVGRYLDWYQVTGVCFDRAAVESEHIGYYDALTDRARTMGVHQVMLNHGTHPAKEYAGIADVLGTFEGPWSSYQDMAVPRWTQSVPKSQLYHVVHSVPREYFEDAYRLAARNRAGCVYITQRTGGNPYDQLPADWYAVETA